jgi:O-succinylbenzoic acid--CoA ligase
MEPGAGTDPVPLTAVRLPVVETADAIRAAWDAGQAVLPLDPRAPAEEVRRALERFRPTHLLDGDGRHPVDGGLGVTSEVAAVVATSGTTGAPRGVELTWSGLRASATAVWDALHVGEGDTWLCCLPLHHVAGLAVVARAFVSGVPVVVVPGFDPALVAGAGANLVSLVPTTLRRALDAGADVGMFRHILLGGAPVDEDLRGRAVAAGAGVVVSYGLTETWGGVVHDGHPLPGVGVRLGELPPRSEGPLGPVGEVVLRGPMTMRGYRLDPEATAAVLDADGWFRTGDAGALDGDGCLQVLDRLDDMVITGGVNVSPTEVEAVLARHPAVADVCVVGAPDPEWGQRVVAYVVPAPGQHAPTLASLRDFARDHLTGPKLPRKVVAVETIPRTSSGKPLRRLLRPT